MTNSAMEVITEDTILRQSKQYDVAVLFEARLSSLRAFSIDSSAFARCKSLTVLHLSHNRLDTLRGIEVLAETLTYLNAAENKLSDIASVAPCVQLRHVLLEGNQLSNRASLMPLTKLTRLEVLCLRRELELDGARFVLDNPISADVKSYATLVKELFPAVRNVDGHFHRDGGELVERKDAPTSEQHRHRLEELNQAVLKDLHGQDVTALEKRSVRLSIRRKRCKTSSNTLLPFNKENNMYIMHILCDFTFRNGFLFYALV
ncbi:leucine rich repeat containing 61 [Strigomonas culicis]|uniref:Leucine rich repeat containing 61 n=1 Tax=Strigomonas culicis TaxID=28005 RepID=S9V998_9TRYP|nr:leucine rich repeat containing 61 [Strigomonas culicis]|eukprot:EPY23551.1 leucine rich repeat containing 61 [Strigomonas culicis]